MRVLNLIGSAVGALLALATGLAAAATIPPEIEFPSYAGAGSFPQEMAWTRTFDLKGERVVSATISGSWGSSVPGGDPNSTSGVNVLLDGVLVAQCVQYDPCYQDLGIPSRPWSYVFTKQQLPLLEDGTVTLSAVQTSATNIQLGITTLRIETAPLPTVPALSPFGVLALLAGMAVAGSLAARRFPRR